jgi:hypothetical protein
MDAKMTLDTLDLESFLFLHEKSYPLPEQTLRIALRALKAQCDGAQDRDDVGFNGGDAHSPFVRDMLVQERQYTPNQLSALYKLLKKYRVQLAKLNIVLPDERDVADVILGKTNGQVTHTTIDVDCAEGFIYLLCPYKEKFRIDNFKVEHSNLREAEGGRWCGPFGRYTPQARCYFMGQIDKSDKRWRIPLTPATFRLLISGEYFPTHIAELTEEAMHYKRMLDEVELEESRKIMRVTEAEQRRYERLVAAIGGLDAPIDVTGQKRLYPHQKVAVELLLRRPRFIVGDETGLGKTYEAAIAAKAYQRLHGYRVYIITTVSSMGMWQAVAEEIDMSVEIFSWGKIIKAENDYPPQPFVLIADEAHNAQSMTSARTKALLSLAWHDNCKGAYMLTGTPAKNGRPINTYPLLLAVKHPMVWGAGFPKGITYPIVWKKKDDQGDGTIFPYHLHDLFIKYQDKFCGRTLKHVGSGTYVWDSNGSTNQFVWNGLVVHDPNRATNHQDACMIARLKDDCVDLPEKQRILKPVELSKEAEAVFWQSFTEMWERFLANVETKLKAFREQYEAKEGHPPTHQEVRAEEARIRRSEAIVQYGAFRHASAIAKIEETVAMAESILDRGSKLVVFTNFRDVAAEVGKRIEANTDKHVSYILGGMSGPARDEVMADFQSTTGRAQVIVSTAAGGEAITLTAAQFMIINDRPWTPGAVKQWEDRIHRLTTTGQVSIYWMQLPLSMTEADIRIDQIIMTKQVNITAMIHGKESYGLDFESELNDQTLSILEQTAKKIKKSKKAA